MSSSKVFKEDMHFTPIPLVQHKIAAREPDTKGPPANLPDPLTPGEKAGEPEQEPQIDLQAIKDEAYNRGIQDQAAQHQVEIQHTIKAFADACQKIDNQRIQRLQQSRGDIINLIITLSTKILGQELSLPRNIIATTLQSALEQAIESEEYYVTLNPDDLAFAEEKVPDLIASIRGLERIVFKTDRSMARGGCLLESAICTVDATIETQMESIKDFLQEDTSALPTPEME